MSAKAPPRQSCLSDEDIRALASFPSSPRFQTLASHVFVCETCARRLEERLYEGCTDLLSDGERESIRRFVDSRCKVYDPSRKLKLWCLMHPPVPRPSAGGAPSLDPDWRKAAANGRRAEGKPPSCRESVSMTFLSLPADAQGKVWRATLTLPAEPDSETGMDVAVVDRDGQPAAGVFTVCGCPVPLVEGKGSLTYRDFVAGLKAGEAYLTLPDGARIPFVLTLF